jgi:hypothetical protein
MPTASTGTCFASFACHDVIWILSTVWLEQLSISMHGSEKALVLKEKFMTEVSRFLLSPTIFHQAHIHFARTEYNTTVLTLCLCSSCCSTLRSLRHHRHRLIDIPRPIIPLTRHSRPIQRSDQGTDDGKVWEYGVLCDQ